MIGRNAEGVHLEGAPLALMDRINVFLAEQRAGLREARTNVIYDANEAESSTSPSLDFMTVDAPADDLGAEPKVQAIRQRKIDPTNPALAAATVEYVLDGSDATSPSLALASPLQCMYHTHSLYPCSVTMALADTLCVHSMRCMCMVQELQSCRLCIFYATICWTPSLSARALFVPVSLGSCVAKCWEGSSPTAVCHMSR